MIDVARSLFFIAIVRPFVYLVLGIRVINGTRLPKQGPAIIVSNHNSHLDTLVLMSVLPVKLLSRVRPVASGGYFLRNRWLAWFSRKIIGIIPIHQGTGLGRHHVLNDVIKALQENNIIIIYPEGTRGIPGQLQKFNRGIAVLTTQLPGVPVYPAYLHGLGKVLPKGEILPVPFICTVVVGEPLRGIHTKGSVVMQQLKDAMQRLSTQGRIPEWE